MSKKINLLMFSGEYDKAMAGLILANAARDIDVEVTMFFSFWGLFLVRDPEKMTLEDKSIYEKLMDVITPKGPGQLPLSHLNFSGLGRMMLEEMMEEQGAPKLIHFLKGARKKTSNSMPASSLWRSWALSPRNCCQRSKSSMLRHI